MPAGFPADVRSKAVDLFLEGMTAREVCDWVEAACGRRPSPYTVQKWVAAHRRGHCVANQRAPHSADTIAQVVAYRLTTGKSYRDVAARYSVSETSPLTWLRLYWPDEEEQQHAASLSFDEVYEATMKRVSKNRKAKRVHQQHRVEANRSGSDALLSVDDLIPGIRSIDSVDELPDDPAELKRLFAEQLDRDKVQRAIIQVLMDGDDTPGKAHARKGEWTSVEKALVVNILTGECNFTIKKACDLLDFNIKTYEYHKYRKPKIDATRLQKRNQQAALVLQAAEESGRSYGYRRIHTWLKQRGYTMSEKVLRPMMRELDCGPLAKQAKKYSSYTGETEHAPQNLLLIKPAANAHNCGCTCTCDCGVVDGAGPAVQLSTYFTEHVDTKGLTHDFHADRPWEKIGTDVTEIHCTDGKLFISAAIDFYDGMPVAVTMSQSPNHDLVAEMMARIDAEKPADATPIIHSDRGGLYRSTRWVELITDHTHDSLACPDCQADAWCHSRWRYIPSLSRKGNSGDNARVEGFFGTMKQERIHGRPAVLEMTVAQMRDYIEDYIDFYINKRLKSTLGKGYTTIAAHRAKLSA